MRKRREVATFGLSFLDAICCGFGAVILLLLLTETLAPTTLEASPIDLDAQIRERQDALFDIRGEIDALQRRVGEQGSHLDARLQQISQLRRELGSAQGEFKQLAELNKRLSSQIETLNRTQQSLTDEQIRLLSAGFERVENDLVGGITVDSEYLIFVIDTSGSMRSQAWSAVGSKVRETLEVYPEIKGIQVMSDMGEYLFRDTAGRWLQDTERQRGEILRRLAAWTSFSNSSPVEGIEAAINTYYDDDKNISIYVFGDDYTGDSIETVVRTIDQLNSIGENGLKRVRISAIGFPVHLDRPNVRVYRFAALMRELAFRNDGTFVGLISNRS